MGGATISSTRTCSPRCVGTASPCCTATRTTAPSGAITLTTSASWPSTTRSSGSTSSYMLSRAERVRRAVEHALRFIAMAAIATLLWRAIRPPGAAGVDVVRRDLQRALARWTRAPATEMRVVFDAAPDPRTRDWLHALVRAGGSVRWSSSRPIGPAAVVAEPAAEPNATTRVRLASASGEAVSVADDAGAIDTLPRGGAREMELGAVA